MQVLARYQDFFSAWGQKFILILLSSLYLYLVWALLPCKSFMVRSGVASSFSMFTDQTLLYSQKVYYSLSCGILNGPCRKSKFWKASTAVITKDLVLQSDWKYAPKRQTNFKECH